MVPFSPSAGLLQWVEQTLPIMEWLCGEGRAYGGHLRYGPPSDYLYNKSASMLHGCPRADLPEVFDDVRTLLSSSPALRSHPLSLSAVLCLDRAVTS